LWKAQSGGCQQGENFGWWKCGKWGLAEGLGIGIGWVLPANLNKQSVKLTILQIQTKPHTRTQKSETEGRVGGDTPTLGGWVLDGEV